jgi:hypothetical protein
MEFKKKRDKIRKENHTIIKRTKRKSSITFFRGMEN